MLKKKSLGQHFLRSRSTLRKIVEAAHLSADDTVLEAGPGEGALTELLLLRARKVIAVEKDDRLIPILECKFQNEIAAGKLELVHADILTLDTNRYTLNAKRYKFVANIPYYITGALIRKFLESDTPPSAMVLLLQKEVAKRIVANGGKESILSISVKAYGTPTYVGSVKARAFSPPPKVDSAIIAIENISREFFADKDERRFFGLLKKGFAHPRKLVASNLEIPAEKLKECGIEGKARPETLSPQNWKCLSKSLRNS